MSGQNPDEFGALSDEQLAEFLARPVLPDPQGLAPSDDAQHVHHEPSHAERLEPVMRPEWEARIESAADMAALLESVMPLVLEWAANVAGQEAAPAVDWDEETGLTLGYLCGGCAEETEEVAR